MNTTRMFAAAAALITLSGCAGTGMAPGARQLMIVGNDEKVVFIDGRNTPFAPGKDTVSIIDIGTDPLNPRIIANLPLMNTIVGPPTTAIFRS